VLPINNRIIKTMSDNFLKQSQFELFPHQTDEKSLNTPKKGLELKDLTLSVENIILLSIILVMGLILFFSFGVERGKHLAQSSVDINVYEDIATVIQTQDISEAIERVELPSALVVDVDPLMEVEADETREIIKVPQVEEIEITDDLFTIQVASFKLEKNAQKEADILRDKGFDSLVVDKGNYSIVCVGKFSHRNVASDFARKLQNRYNDYLVRRL
jgi:hypothetical protein